METEIDRPTVKRVTDLGNGFILDISSRTFSSGVFTNMYDVSWNPDDARGIMYLSPRPVEAVGAARSALVTATAAFFVLLDQTSGLPIVPAACAADSL
jgi:hypothetical protein